MSSIEIKARCHANPKIFCPLSYKTFDPSTPHSQNDCRALQLLPQMSKSEIQSVLDDREQVGNCLYGDEFLRTAYIYTQ
ncbi:hypothetical protein HYW54_04275 [Candidatus Gottesmanbacteria bacterium]|nr:hypothetical protein [Candidatus Gottesmanbacteria bacterium]